MYWEQVYEPFLFIIYCLFVPRSHLRENRKWTIKMENENEGNQSCMSNDLCHDKCAKRIAIWGMLLHTVDANKWQNFFALACLLCSLLYILHEHGFCCLLWPEGAKCLAWVEAPPDSAKTNSLSCHYSRTCVFTRKRVWVHVCAHASVHACVFSCIVCVRTCVTAHSRWAVAHMHEHTDINYDSTKLFITEKSNFPACLCLKILVIASERKPSVFNNLLCLFGVLCFMQAND